MSTHATIGIDNGDGTVLHVYLHFDGYPTHAGQTLVEHYATAEKARALLEYGDISELGTMVESSTFYRSTFYRRDRGEASSSLRSPIATWNTELGSYSYLFQNGRWRAWNAALVELDLVKSIAQGTAIVLEQPDKTMVIVHNSDGRPCGWGIADSEKDAREEAEWQYQHHRCYDGEKRGRVSIHRLPTVGKEGR